MPSAAKLTLGDAQLVPSSSPSNESGTAPVAAGVPTAAPPTNGSAAHSSTPLKSPPESPAKTPPKTPPPPATSALLAHADSNAANAVCEFGTSAALAASSPIASLDGAYSTQLSDTKPAGVRLDWLVQIRFIEIARISSDLAFPPDNLIALV